MRNQDDRTIPVHLDGVGFQRRLFAHLRDEGKTILSFNAYTKYTKELTIVIHWMALESKRVVGSMILGESSIARVRPGTQDTRIRKSRADIGKYGHYLPRERKRCQREGEMMRVSCSETAMAMVKEGEVKSRTTMESAAISIEMTTTLYFRGARQKGRRKERNERLRGYPAGIHPRLAPRTKCSRLPLHRKCEDPFKANYGLEFPTKSEEVCDTQAAYGPGLLATIYPVW
ncbi:hypothetical protein K438DRAFT_1782682 [Mycena galopus ATCC 62051]|nr:hypothetical protein K438DRAFT_1782682 [Mycena galopus ATCC 62051]